MSQVFRSVDTFHNCLAFPTINNILSTVNVTDEYKDIAQAYGITGGNTSASSGVVNQVSSCLASYCSDSSNSYTPGRRVDQGNGSDTSCTNLQNLDHFPIILDAFPYVNFTGIPIYCEANAATVYVGDGGRDYRYLGEVTDRHTYCNTSLTINGTATPRARLDYSMGALGCISSICNGVLQNATVNSEIGGIGV